MAQSDTGVFLLPRKLRLYLQRLHTDYTNRGEAILAQLTIEPRCALVEGADSDHWQGHIGHAVTLYATPELLGLVPLDEQDAICQRIRDDLNKACKSIADEYVSSVALELEDQNDPAFQASERASAQAAEIPPFWLTDHIRAFISHRDTHKRQAHELAGELVGFGCSGFVAHDTIEGDAEWQKEIEKGLQTMEVMVALITDDFFESVWTNQEIGFALGRGVPVISVKLGKVPPLGFIQLRQAVKAGPNSCQLIFEKIAGRVGNERAASAIVSRFIQARSFDDAKWRFDRLDEFGACGLANAERIITAYSENSQLSSCYYLNNGQRRINYLSQSTGRSYERRGKMIVEV